MASNVSFSLSFDSGNEAIVNDPELETIIILRKIAEKIEIHGKRYGAVKEHNGNTIGKWSLDVEELAGKV